MLLKISNKSKGDTIIEVLIAITIFSFVAVGAMSIMNQGVNTAQRALEITLVRNQIDSQAETLRFLNSSYLAAYIPGATSYTAGTKEASWYRIAHTTPTIPPITKLTKVSATTFTTCPTTNPSNSFVLNTKKAQIVVLNSNFLVANSFSQIKYDSSDNVVNSYGIWVEAVTPPTPIGDEKNASYIDFHIRACWYTSGQSIPMTLGTIVRLYEPN